METKLFYAARQNAVLRRYTPGAETMAPTPAKESDGAAAPVVGAVAAAIIAVVALL